MVFVVVNIIHLYFEMYIMYKSVSSFHYSTIDYNNDAKHHGLHECM